MTRIAPSISPAADPSSTASPSAASELVSQGAASVIEALDVSAGAPSPDEFAAAGDVE
jgi:hypothetical protein